jgi:hypothetical protein
MHIKRKTVSDQATELNLNEFHSANGRIRIGQMISYPVKELLARRDFLSDANRIIY